MNLDLDSLSAEITTHFVWAAPANTIQKVTYEAYSNLLGMRAIEHTDYPELASEDVALKAALLEADPSATEW
jgi:hypothetical protein